MKALLFLVVFMLGCSGSTLISKYPLSYRVQCTKFDFNDAEMCVYNMIHELCPYGTAARIYDLLPRKPPPLWRRMNWRFVICI